MPHWLAARRFGQDTAWMQRFDPRFWTVNFPRPMMASVVTTAPDALRVDCDFYHRGELAGLIWDSADTLSHPLLAYATDRDYARTTLRFRWRSAGLIPLDQPNGPTLTIEGRDHAGRARSWYVRLWNYAVGTPTDARITLPFSALQSGYGLTGEAVYPHDIDRMFVSLAPPGYLGGSDDALPRPVSAHVVVSDIACTGDRPMLALGDVMLPPHDVQIATGYDDAYNQTPARLLRELRGLGYRGRVLHYVGMSHFFRLTDAGGRLEAARDDIVCEPARRWHGDFFQRAADTGFAVVASLSFEMFAANCPADWRQLADNGEPAETGWVPPSNLLSPANDDAVSWLEAVAAEFVALMRQAGLPVLFQIGEPWWWVMADGRPCLYDDAARAAFGTTLTAIPTMRAPLSVAQTNLLDRAGEVLATATARVADAVRALDDNAELLLLAFTPTILDPAMPEFKRANMPVGWAYPAFDRLQLEDYDWLTAGADGARRAAYREVDARLRYPLDRQDYLSGFVLAADDADAFWPLIDDALDEAARRGVPQRYVWALPQVSRDGYVRLPFQNEETDVPAFDDVPYPLALGRDTAVSPEFSTTRRGHRIGLRTPQFAVVRRAAAVRCRPRHPFGSGTGAADRILPRPARGGACVPPDGPDRPFQQRDDRYADPCRPADRHRRWRYGGLSLDQTLWERRRRANPPHHAPRYRQRPGQRRWRSGKWLVARHTRHGRFSGRPRRRGAYSRRIPVRRSGAVRRRSPGRVGAHFAAGDAPSVPLIEVREGA